MKAAGRFRTGRGALAPAPQHPQQLAGLQALLLRQGVHVQPHVHEELGHVHLLPGELVPDGGARGVAVGPGAAVHQVDRAALQGGFAGLVAVMEASVPAVKRPGQRGPLHLHICPVAADRNPGRRHSACGQSRRPHCCCRGRGRVWILARADCPRAFESPKEAAEMSRGVGGKEGCPAHAELCRGAGTLTFG